MPHWVHGLGAAILLASALLAPACRGQDPAATPTPDPADVPELAMVWEAWSVLSNVYVGDGRQEALDRRYLVDEAVRAMLSAASSDSDAFWHQMGQLEGRPPSTVPEGLEDIWRAWRVLIEDGPKVGPEELAQAAVRGLVEGVNDEYTQFLDPAEYQRQRAALEGHYEGIGVVVAEQPSGMLVVSVFPGSPADLVGLQPGDVLTEADGVSLRGLSADEAATLLRGPEGTTVKVAVERAVGGEETFSIVRGAIDVPTVDYELIQEGIGYLWVRQISRHTPEELRDALRELRRADAQAIVLDLRGNPGGSLTASIAVASEFLSEGLVMYAIDRDGERTDHPVTEGGTALAEPLAVLVDGSTASAAEVVAAALQAHDRARLFGARTFGKGSVTTVRRLADGSVIRISSSHWFAPDGREIQGQGVQPDVRVTLFLQDLIQQRDRALLLAVDYLRDRLDGVPDTGPIIDDMDLIDIPPPPGGPTQAWERAVELFHQALVLQHQGRFSEAIETYRRSIDTHPTAEAYTFLAWTYSWMARYEDAIEEAQKAIEVDPDYGNPYNDIGMYLIALGRHEEAVPWLEQAMEAPRYAEPQFPHLNLGLVRVLQDDWEQAFQHFLTAWELRPEAMRAQFPTGGLDRVLPPPGRRSAPSPEEAAAVSAALAGFADAWGRHDAGALQEWASPLIPEHAQALLVYMAWSKWSGTPLAISDVETLHLEGDLAVARATVREGDDSGATHYLVGHVDGGWKVVMALR